MSAVSLPQLQWECWSMDRMCTHQGIWKHALSPHSSSQLLLRAWLEHSQALRSGRDVQEGRCGATVKVSCSTPGATHLPALIQGAALLHSLSGGCSHLQGAFPPHIPMPSTPHSLALQPPHGWGRRKRRQQEQLRGSLEPLSVSI